MEQLRPLPGLPEQEHVEVAVAVVIADRRSVAHVLLHERAVGVGRGKDGSVVAGETQPHRARHVGARELRTEGRRRPGRRHDRSDEDQCSRARDEQDREQWPGDAVALHRTASMHRRALRQLSRIRDLKLKLAGSVTSPSGVVIATYLPA